MKFKNSIYTIIAIVLLLQSSCSLDEKWHREVLPREYFDSKENVEAFIARVFTHVRWYVVNDRWRLQELTADGFCVSTKGPHWYNGGVHGRLLQHRWTPDDDAIWETWRGGTMGIALALETIEDLDEYVDYESLGMTQEDKQRHFALLKTAIAYMYMRNLDFFGGMPIFTFTKQENVPRSSALETFNHVDTMLTSVIKEGYLHRVNVKTRAQEQWYSQAAAAMMQAQLYFNAETYIGTPMFDKAETIVKDIIDGKYGSYSLDETWHGIHGFENHKSPEMIWTIPSQYVKLQYDWFWSYFYHYESYKYFDSDQSSDNGCHLQPSRKPTGEIYSEFKLGNPFESFHAEDLRKQPFVYHGNGKYDGMFLVGYQTNPNTGISSRGTQEYKDSIIEIVDQVARFSKIGKPNGAKDTISLVSNIDAGEENSGVRLVKVPQPNLADKTMRWNPDQPAFRLAEVYYMYAECLLRRGAATEASKWINEVRKRNFIGGTDPDPVTDASLDADGYRMLKEWQVEFLGEGRRRTDLIRWKKFITEDWWDHKGHNDANKNRFPVPTKAISGSNLLEQNPGY